jgi:hypothetical protein
LYTRDRVYAPVPSTIAVASNHFDSLFLNGFQSTNDFHSISLFFPVPAFELSLFSSRYCIGSGIVLSLVLRPLEKSLSSNIVFDFRSL